MNNMIFRSLVLFLGIFLVGVSFAFAAELKPRKVGPKDKCAVCGMFVAKYPDFAAQIQFRDGSTFHFDGTKDMFKYYLNLSRYAPGKKTTDITAVLVTNYYDLTMVDGLPAYYVMGSDVFGPMGRELVPFVKEAQAREFLRDHKGKSIIRFRDVTPALLKQLD
ncbi:nitrous oxide reductase accessory protein NosL [Pelotalea chapellei]|nr:nitrous oxide reductase accessory protein NosL [Pelotalea chapellei]